MLGEKFRLVIQSNSVKSMLMGSQNASLVPLTANADIFSGRWRLEEVNKPGIQSLTGTLSKYTSIERRKRSPRLVNGGQKLFCMRNEAISQMIRSR